MKRGAAFCARIGDESSMNSRMNVRIASAGRGRSESTGVESVESDGGEETMLSVIRHRPFGRRATEFLSRIDVEAIMNSTIDPRQSRLNHLRVELRRLAREVVGEYRRRRGRDA